MAPGLNWPILNATALDGGWDFTLLYTRNQAMMMGPARGGNANDPAEASDPVGGLTIFEALEKQLGLKLATQKRTMPVIVIDRIEQKPTDN
jgi:uncharacterized protein (TIGR03435 family)